MPAQLVAAAVLATGYTGPLSLEVFNHTLNAPDANVPVDHAERGIISLRDMVAAARQVPAFWDTPERITVEALTQLYEKQTLTRSES